MGAHANLRAATAPLFRHTCGLCSLQEWCWLPGLDETDLKRLHAIVRHSRSLPKGHHLFRVGDPFTAIYAVNSGCIKSYTTDPQGGEHVRDFHLPGELLGFDAAYPDRHRFNALIIKPASVCIIPYRDIAVLSRQIPGLQTPILALMSRFFSRQQLCVEGSDATQQVAILLFDLEARLRRGYGADDEFDLPMSHESIANYLRISPETMSRVISKLQEAGAITVNRGHIRLLDVACLNRIVQGAQLE